MTDEPQAPGLYLQTTPETVMCIACGIAWRNGDDEIHHQACVVARLTAAQVDLSHTRTRIKELEAALAIAARLHPEDYERAEKAEAALRAQEPVIEAARAWKVGTSKPGRADSGYAAYEYAAYDLWNAVDALDAGSAAPQEKP